MAIPQDLIDKIQDSVDILEVISGYIPLKKIGKSHKAACPFHNEKTPSFIVSPEKQIYHCFGCGVGGNVFSFVMKYENIAFPEAVEMLAKKAGIALPRSSGKNSESNSLANQLYAINDSACQFFSANLANNRVKEYLASRGIGDEAIKKFNLGYASEGWEGLLGFFKKKGFDAALLEKAGLVISNERGGYYDRFRDRITFPIMDVRSRALGFGARVLDSSLPKYINSPETYIYSKGKNLYGLNISKDDIKREGHALMVEGYFDFIIPYQAGVKNIVATLGTALTVDQIKLLKRFANTVIMVYDPDLAGEAASIRNLDLFISEDVNVYIAELPAGFDPDGYIRKFGAEEFRRLIKSSKNLFEYKIGKLTAKFDINSVYGKTKIAQEMMPTLARINNAVMKSSLMKKLAERLSVDEESIRSEMKKMKSDYAGSHQYPQETARPRDDSKSAEKMLLAILLEGGDYTAKIIERIGLEELKSTSIREVVGMIFDSFKNGRHITPAKLISHLGSSSEGALLVSEAVSISEMVIDKEKVLLDCIAKIKKDNAKDKMNRLQEAIKIAYNSKEEDKYKRLMAEFDSLVKTNKA